MYMYMLARVEALKALGIALSDYRILRRRAKTGRGTMDYFIRTRLEGEPMESIPATYFCNIDDSSIEEKVNMPQDLSDEERQEWMLNETVWSSAYEDYIWNISRNRIARNVMIHKLEDMLDVLRNPGKYEDESGKQYYILPWKKHYVVDLSRYSGRIPQTDDTLLLRDPTDLERKNLIDKYSKALEILEEMEDRFPVRVGYTEEDRQEHERNCKRWFISWMEDEKSLLEEYGDEESGLEAEEMLF